MLLLLYRIKWPSLSHGALAHGSICLRRQASAAAGLTGQQYVPDCGLKLWCRAWCTSCSRLAGHRSWQQQMQQQLQQRQRQMQKEEGWQAAAAKLYRQQRRRWQQVRHLRAVSAITNQTEHRPVLAAATLAVQAAMES